MCNRLPHDPNPFVHIAVIVTCLFVLSNLGMEPNDKPATHPPPCTPTVGKFKVGDIVHVFQGTAAYVRGRNTVAFIGRIVGYNTEANKWEVYPEP